MAAVGNSDGGVTVAVGGGKGGVGKSLISVNLAVALARLGSRVVLVDGDLGAANLHTLLGIDRPGPTLQALINKQIESLEEAVIPTPFSRLFVVPGSGAVAGAANPAHFQKLKLMRHIQSLEADVVIVDCGAGASFNVIDLFNMTDIRLAVATPQLTSLQNAYGFVKGAVYRAIQHRATNDAERALLKESVDGRETEKVRDLLEHVAFIDSDLALDLAHAVDTFGIALVSNQVDALKEVHALHALSRMMRDFLEVQAPVWASIPRSARVHASVTRRAPVVGQYPSCHESVEFMKLAEKVLTTDVAALREARAARPRVAAGQATSRTPSWRARSDDKPEPLPTSLTAYLRRHERLEVDWAATVVVEGQSLAGRVKDVSQGGLSFLLEAPAEVRGRVTVLLESLPEKPAVHGCVRYGANRRLGIELIGKRRREEGALLVRFARANTPAAGADFAIPAE